MSLDKLWKRWLILTTLFTVLLCAVDLSFIIYRSSYSVQESRLILRQLLSTHLESESPRIAEELYLRLESLNEREKILNQLIGKYGTVKLSFQRNEQNGEETDHSVLAWSDHTSSSTLLTRVNFGDIYLGNLVTTVNWIPSWKFSSFQNSLWVSIFSILLILAVWLGGYHLVKARVFSPALKEFEEKAAQEGLARIAAQVAHDIRSPLAALAMIESELGATNEETRLIARSAISRIKDIANNLLRQHPQNSDAAQELSIGKNLTSENLFTLLDSVLTEKRIQYRSNLNISIETKVAPQAYSLFCKLDASEFKTVISNIVNNAVEAKNVSEVLIELKNNGPRALITVKDDGAGIPNNVINRLGERGFSHDKSSGNGLGLYHAIQKLNEWSGMLKIESDSFSGTNVTIELPVCEPPMWAIQSLNISTNTKIIVLDDDQSIHHIWRGRFDHFRTRFPGISMHHFSTPSELLEYYSRHFHELDDALFLIDYEILGNNMNGLQLIERAGIQAQSCLVTSRYEDPNIRQDCLRLGLYLLPKQISGFIPIHLKQESVFLSDKNTTFHLPTVDH